MTNVENFNDQSMGEEIANAISHGVGAALAVAGTVVLIVSAALHSDARTVVTVCLYGFSVIFLYLMSTLYHSFTNHKVKQVFQVFDHCSIFLLILGSYIPICLALLRGPLGWTLFGINAGLALFGLTVNAISVRRWHQASQVLYLLMGWSVVIVLRPMLQLVGWQGFLLLLAGGLCYSVGVVFYHAVKPRFMHTVWHFWVLSGSVLHYFFVLFYIVLR